MNRDLVNIVNDSSSYVHIVAEVDFEYDTFNYLASYSVEDFIKYFSSASSYDLTGPDAFNRRLLLKENLFIYRELKLYIKNERHHHMFNLLINSKESLQSAINALINARGGVPSEMEWTNEALFS